jgi:NTP pyrophosphatase (non-canonical NTP hydrolase)
MTLDIRQMQKDVGEWQRHNFQDKATATNSFLGIVEELGELAHAILKQNQGIRGTKIELEAAAKDALGDMFIFTMGFCWERGWDLEAILAATWREVQKRDWRRDPMGAGGESAQKAARRPGPAAGAGGQP